MGTNIQLYVEYKSKGSQKFQWCDCFELDRDYDLFEILGYDGNMYGIKHRDEPTDKSPQLCIFLTDNEPNYFGSWLSCEEIYDIFNNADDIFKSKMWCIVNYIGCRSVEYDVRLIYWFS